MMESAFGGDPNIEFGIEDAIRRIFNEFGDIVSVTQKKQALLKFGRSRAIGGDQKGTVWVAQDTGQPDERFATENKVRGLSSSDTGDFGTVFRVEGCSLDTGTGFQSFGRDVTCLGQTQASFDGGARGDRIYVKPSAWPLVSRPATGTIYVYDTGLAGGLSAGVPNVPAATKVLLEGDTGWSDTGEDQKGPNQTQKLATTLAHDEYWIAAEVFLAIGRSGPQSARVDAEIEYRQLGGVWRPVGLELSLEEGAQTEALIPLRPYAILPKNSDVRMRAQSTIASTLASGFINGYLAKVIR
jgi:hypothetical protein